jgi:Tfp pilus tip-associated adhesin PilY1
VDLNLLSGERVVTDPELEAGGGVVLTTYQPNPSACQGGGSAWLMVFNFATGGSFPLPELDTNGDIKLNSQDAGMLGSNPVGMSLGPVYASQAILLPMGTSLGGVQGTVSKSRFRATTSTRSSIAVVPRHAFPGGRSGIENTTGTHRLADLRQCWWMSN